MRGSCKNTEGTDFENSTKPVVNLGWIQILQLSKRFRNLLTVRLQPMGSKKRLIVMRSLSWNCVASSLNPGSAS